MLHKLSSAMFSLVETNVSTGWQVPEPGVECLLSGAGCNTATPSGGTCVSEGTERVRE